MLIYSIEEKLRIIERNIMSRIHGPIKTDQGEIRILMNHEIRNLMEGDDIVGFSQAQRLKWFGHIQRRGADELIRQITNWTPVINRPIGRPKIRWEDQLREDISNMEITSWTPSG